jgi:hypothetical protein
VVYIANLSSTPRRCLAHLSMSELKKAMQALNLPRSPERSDLVSGVVISLRKAIADGPRRPIDSITKGVKFLSLLTAIPGRCPYLSLFSFSLTEAARSGIEAECTAKLLRRDGLVIETSIVYVREPIIITRSARMGLVQSWRACAM